MRSLQKHSLWLFFILALLLGSGCTPQARKNRALAKADKYFAANDYSQAEIEYRNVIKLDAENARAYNQLD